MSEETQPGFGAAMGELEEILERIEGEEIDIDRLAEELRRAAELLDLCRGKIRRAEVEVTQIVQSLEEDEAPSDEAPAGDGPGVEDDDDEEEDEDDQDDIPF